MLASLLLNRYVLGFIGVLAVVAGLTLGWYQLKEKYRNEGRAELLPQLEADKKAFDQIAASMLVIKQNSEKIKQQVARAASINATRNKAETARVATIEAIQPAGATECERTDDAITRALR